ncbi:hypothetical protein LINPERPRIM_LOCUS1710 [Linum perenne]
MELCRGTLSPVRSVGLLTTIARMVVRLILTSVVAVQLLGAEAEIKEVFITVFFFV